MSEGKYGRSWRDYAHNQEAVTRHFERYEEIIDSEESKEDQEEE